ncbi:MAG: hypothetical protein QOH35_3178, partial [Acidobacteriaceae bacterium]|nr:hypothetical protein [Acidobacteriaceae bacterium]
LPSVPTVGSGKSLAEKTPLRKSERLVLFVLPKAGTFGTS